MSRWTTVLSAAALVLGGCGREEGARALDAGVEVDAGGDGAVDGDAVMHLGEVVDEDGEGVATLDVQRAGGESRVVIDLDGAARIVEVAATFEGGTAALDGETASPADGVVWFRPRPVTAATLELSLTGDGPAQIRVWARGAPVPAARRERSLVWFAPALLDDPARVGLGRLMAAAADDGHGGRLLEAWFDRFATTAHSERAGPAQLIDEIAAEQGDDPATWDLDALPFMVTGVHNRLDLAPRDGGCGQFRVSVASTHPIYAPMHLLFLFRMPPGEDDVAPDGAVHCLGTARRWARLSALDGADFVAAATRLLDEQLVHERFLMAETVELTVSPWEWRQWTPAGEDALDNPPLFQTVDVAGLDPPGPRRDDFLDFVADNAEGLSTRTVEIPERFRAPSAQAPPSAPRTLLDLTGLDPTVAARYPDLAAQIEDVGCPACHTHDTEFVQTSMARAPSDFYDRELDARAVRLDQVNAGVEVPMPPFGALQ